MKRVKNLLGRTVREYRKDIVIVIPVTAYIAVWSIISYYRIASLNATYADFALFMDRMWLIPHINWNMLSFFAIFSNTGLQFLMFPISYFGTPTFYVILQSIAIGGTGVPIYLISKAKLKSYVLSYLISCSFLIYFPIAGLNIFDVHYQAFFPIFFVTAYFLYIRGNMKASFVLFFISGIIRYPFFIFVALFATEGLVSMLYENLKLKDKVINWKCKKFIFLFSLLALSIIFLVIRVKTASVLGGLPSTGNLSSAYNFHGGMMTLLFVFGPLLFIPLLSERWILFYLPFFYMVFFSPNNAYAFPHIFMLQYTSYLVPFVYLGLIEGLYNIQKIRTSIKVMRNRIRRESRPSRPERRKIDPKVIAVIAILALLIMFDTYYEPYGPFNGSTKANYDLNEYFNANMTEYEALEAIVKLIPRNDPYVLTQDNIIEVYPRGFMPNNLTGTGLIAGFTGIGYNLTHQEILANQFPYLMNGKTFFVKVDYILADTESYWCNYHSAYPSLAELLGEIYPTGLYGIVASYNGIVLLERNYTGPILIYSPIHYEMGGAQFFTYWHAEKHGNKIFVTNSNKSTVDGIASWYGPYDTLPPGTYQVTFYLETTNTSKNNTIVLDIINWPNNLAALTINGSSFTSANRIQMFNLTFSTDTFFNSLEYRGIDAVWNGTLTFYGVTVEQLSYQVAR